METTNINTTTLNGPAIENIGTKITRNGLALILIWIGLLKFTSYEAEGIKPLIEHSPLISWGYSLLSVTGLSMLIGAVEILSGILIACRPFSPKASAIGSIGATITFFITLTFLLSTPGVIQMGYGFPFISPQPAQFLLKDIVLFGAAIWSAGEALTASRTNLHQ